MSENRPTAVATLQIDNERVIVTEWRFATGAETGWHRHAYDYIVIPGMDGKLLLQTSDNEQLAELRAGRSYYRNAGVEHNVVNANAFEFPLLKSSCASAHKAASTTNAWLAPSTDRYEHRRNR